MHDGSVLDLGLDPRFAETQRCGGVSGRSVAKLSAVVVVLALVAIAGWRIGGDAVMARIAGFSKGGAPVTRFDLEDLRRIEDMTVDNKAQIIVEGSDAQERNSLLPISKAPIEHVGKFRLAALAEARGTTALTCLTQAIYYEAAFEPLQGRRAVAQVVLNRVRHPAYPNSVCGVVYQGSHRRTGCQFSFTCDGSLLRKPAARSWREAEAIAAAALSGQVEDSVGTATHYHADYVLPKWAFGLGKLKQLGRHIFYRFNGRLGEARAFTGRYSGVEAIPSIDFAALRMRSGEDVPELADALVPGLSVTPHVTDRHAKTDVGGRLDTTKEWRLTIPDPTQASTRYREVIEATRPAEKMKPVVAEANGAARETSQ